MTLLHPWDSPIGVPCLSCNEAGCAHCGFTGTAYDIARARTPFSWIVPNLAQGGHSCSDCLRCETWPEGFDLIVDMRRTELPDPPRLQDRAQFRIPDAALTDEMRRTVGHAVYAVCDSLAHGKRVLVRCHWGLNRSGLVVGLVLRELGFAGEEAVRAIRQRRSPWAISNSDFEKAVLEA